MKHFLNLIPLLLFSALLHAQVGINNIDPKASLDITATNSATPANTDGLLIPRIDAFPAINPTAAQQGMMVYLTTTSGSNPSGFYYWDNNAGPAAWVSVVGGTVQKLNDLSDGKSDSDGSQDGSSVFLGLSAGANDDSSDNKNVGIGFEALKNNSIGDYNVAIGYQSQNNDVNGQRNISLGYQTLFTNSTGTGNIAIGHQAGFSNNGGQANIFLGYYAGFSETGSSKLYIENSGSNSDNALIYGEFDTNILRVNGELQLGTTAANRYKMPTADGTANQLLATDGAGQISFVTRAFGAEKIDDLSDGKSDSDGSQDGSSVFLGINAGANDDSSDNKNVGVGFEALKANTTTYQLTAVGYQSLRSNTTGFNNSAFGYRALYSNTTGGNNAAFGTYSLLSNTTGSGNTGLGFHALNGNTTGGGNTGIGRSSLYSNTTGYSNSALGYVSLAQNISGFQNTALGLSSLYNNTSGSKNSALGYQSLFNNTIGINNTGIGYQTGYNNTTGNANVFLGYLAGFSETGSNKLYIENSSVNSNNALIYGEFDTNILRTNSQFQIGNPTGTGYAFPTTDGTLNQILATDGSGQISFVDASSVNDDWANIGSDIERQSGNVYIGDTNLTNNDLYVSDRIIDWDATTYYLDPDDISKVDEIEFDSGSIIDPSIRFSDADTGFFSPSTATTAYSANGTEAFRINTTGDISIGSAGSLNYKLLIENPVVASKIYIGSKMANDDVMKIDHNGQRGDGLQVNVTNGYTLSSRSAFVGNNTYINVVTSIAKYSGSSIYGVENSISGNINFPVYGVYNYIANSGNGTHYGTQNRLLGTGSGTKYGSYNLIPSTAGGTHFGVYSSVPKSGSYAGYFLGRVSIGSITTDNYILPSSRGTNGQVMQTDGSGNLSWVNTSSLGTDDQNISGSGLSGTNLTIGIENGTNQVIDLSSLQDGTGTDDQNITSATLTGSTLAIAIESGSGASVDLSPLQDADWFETGGTPPNSINDNIYTYGRVGINTTIPDTRLHLKHFNNATSSGFKLENASGNYWRLYTSSASGNLRFYSSTNGNALTGKINGASGTYTPVSDRRLKKDFNDLYFQWENFMNLKPLTYRFKAQKDDKKFIGLVAQDVENIYPELVSYSAEDDVYQLDYSATGIIAIKAVQELKKEVVTLSNENKKLKHKLNKYENLEARLSALENKINQSTTALVQIEK